MLAMLIRPYHAPAMNPLFVVVLLPNLSCQPAPDPAPPPACTTSAPPPHKGKEPGASGAPLCQIQLEPSVSVRISSIRADTLLVTTLRFSISCLQKYIRRFLLPNLISLVQNQIIFYYYYYYYSEDLFVFHICELT